MFGGGCLLLNQDILASKSPIMCNLGFLIWLLILQHYPNPRSIFNLRKRLACLIVNPLLSLSLRLNVYFNEFNPDMNYHNWRSSLLRIQIFNQLNSPNYIESTLRNALNLSEIEFRKLELSQQSKIMETLLHIILQQISCGHRA